jgi:hypothetical protein
MKMLLLFSHTLTDAQRVDAEKSLGVTEFVPLPPDLQYLWSNIDPNADKLLTITANTDYKGDGSDRFAGVLAPIAKWVLKHGDCIVMVQGDFGATVTMVKFFDSYGIETYHSTTERVASEVKNGDGSVTLTHTFSHVKFRRY